ncbi:MAG: 2-oxoacid:ferredoxin oxidoreductase subunit beta [Planctomycetota bacterium]
MNTTPEPLTKKDFKTDQDVRWCPGCGDYAILNAVQGAMVELGRRREDVVFISGIGCSSRFPYYMETYGFHTIHGRAPAIATGVKLANPALDVWMVTGDGDALSIGGNHLIHALRRRVGIKMLLFNNRIYGLTKGQYSPTSEVGKVTKSTPMGSLDTPFDPIQVALGAGATFIARGVDIMGAELIEVMKRAALHEGGAFIEIMQNCNIFNDGAWADVADRNIREDHLVHVKHGEPLVFGRESDKGIVLRGLRLEVVSLADHAVEDLLVWDETDAAMAWLFCGQVSPGLPSPIGVLHSRPAENFEDGIYRQLAAAREKKGAGSLDALLYSGDIWTVEG